MHQNGMYSIFNQSYVQEQQRQWNMQMNRQMHHDEQMRKVMECVQKLDDFMKSAKEVSPEYQNIAVMLCCVELGKYINY